MKKNEAGTKQGGHKRAQGGHKLQPFSLAGVSGAGTTPLYIRKNIGVCPPALEGDLDFEKMGTKKMGTKENESESKLQAEIVHLLQVNGIFCHSVPNEAGGRSKIMQSVLVSMGLRKGVGDLVVWWPTDGSVNIGYLELKTRRGKQSEAQEEFQRLCNTNKIFYAVVRDLDTVITWIEETRKTLTWDRFSIGRKK